MGDKGGDDLDDLLLMMAWKGADFLESLACFVDRAGAAFFSVAGTAEKIIRRGEPRRGQVLMIIVDGG